MSHETVAEGIAKKVIMELEDDGVTMYPGAEALIYDVVTDILKKHHPSDQGVREALEFKEALKCIVRRLKEKRDIAGNQSIYNAYDSAMDIVFATSKDARTALSTPPSACKCEELERAIRGFLRVYNYYHSAASCGNIEAKKQVNEAFILLRTALSDKEKP